MPMLPMKKTKPKALQDDIYFYNNEILPDFQARQKAALKEQKTMLDVTPNHVGMQTINARTHRGKYFVEFASSSSIHGLNHLVAPHRHPIERFLALLFIGGALTCLICLSWIFWGRYQNEATVTVLNNDRDNFLIAKPAYYVCVSNNVEKNDMPVVFERYNIKYTTETERFFEFLSNVTYENMRDTPEFDEVPPEKWLAVLYDLRKSKGKVLKNTEPETSIVTERGICMAIRCVFAVYASVEYWMANNWTVEPIPSTVPRYTYETVHGTIESVSAEQRVQFGMTDPFDMIEYRVPMRIMQERALDHISLIMNQITAQVNVKDLRVRQRHCKLPEDGGLETWPVYTEGMCIIECRTRIIRDKCGCRPHFVRPIEGIPTCNTKQLRCIGDITDLLFLDRYPPASCDCFPNCNEVTYQTRDGLKSELRDGAPTNLSLCNMAIEFPSIVYTQTLLFGFTDFLAAVGGAAGLFLGASVLSFVEIFFYATLRMGVYVKNVHSCFKKK